jgi:hypothetical protein
MKKQMKKLVLSRETLRDLDEGKMKLEGLKDVQGGGDGRLSAIDLTCLSCTCPEN